MTLCEHTEWKRDAILKVAETSSNQGISYLPYITGAHHLLDVSKYRFLPLFLFYGNMFNVLSYGNMSTLFY